ncbi:MAG: ABC transporter permease [Firmicutes bacterium]|nr:ABC transporter permease [Bacillota bacterium]
MSSTVNNLVRNPAVSTGSTLLHDTWWICWRELKRLWGQKMRIIMTLLQPVLWLTLMGNMFQRMAAIPGFPAKSYLDYMAPGIVMMVTLFGGIFGGMSIVWDRRFGYLQKLLAAPISRTAIVTGKMLSIAIQAAFQALVILGLALLMGAHFAAGPVGALALVLLAVLTSQVFAAFSLALGAVITSHEALMAVTNFFTMPLMFTSNAMMPLEMMPAWLAKVAMFNPLSYGINPMRTLFLSGWEWSSLAQGIVVLGAAAAAATMLASGMFRRSIA